MSSRHSSPLTVSKAVTDVCNILHYPSEILSLLKLTDLPSGVTQIFLSENLPELSSS